MDFFDRFVMAFSESKIEYAHSLPICNKKYEFLFFFDSTNKDGKSFVKSIDSIYVRNISDMTMNCYDAKQIVPKEYYSLVEGREIIYLDSVDEELDLEDQYFKLYETYYNSLDSIDETLLLEIEGLLKKIPISKCMLEIYAFLMQYQDE